ncbi:MAG: ANTAR domain-containing protein [Nitriliruptor sp.]|nr:MAG: ANTAR domain-containing protein [Nitriliruptor sp.]
MTGIVTEPVERFLAHIERGGSRNAIDLSIEQLEHTGVTATVNGLLAPAQQEVGSRWHQGRYTVAQEHLVTAVVDDVLGLCTTYTDRLRESSYTLALVCAEGDWHSTPARMAALLFRDAGWRVQFLGASTPVDHLRTTLRELAPAAVAVSCTLPLALPGAASLIEVAHDLGVPAVVGGRAFDEAGHRATQIGADGHFREPAEAVRHLDRWLDQPPSLNTAVRNPERDRERATLAIRHDGIIQDTYRDLERRLPVMATFDDRQRHHTVEDLDDLLRFADIALFVDDPTVLTEVVSWLGDLLTGRGLSAHVMPRTLAALHTAVGADLPVVRGWLELAEIDLPAPEKRTTPTTAGGRPPGVWRPGPPRRSAAARTENELLEQLAEIAHRLSETESLDELLQLIVDLGESYLDGCDGVSLMLIGKNRTISTPAYTSQVVYESDLAQYQADEGPCLDVLRDHAVYLIDDLETEHRWPAYRALALKLGVRSMLSYRLHAKGQTYGGLDFYSKRPHVYSPSSRAIGQVFASHAGVALKGAITEAGLERAIASRDIIGQAKGILIERRHLTTADAFAKLAELSQRHNIRVREIAEQIVTTGEIPD